MDGQHIPQEDLALFAMLALPSAEQAAVEAHLQGCADCQKELRELKGDLGALALGVRQEPLPSGARDRFFARIAAEKRPNSVAFGPTLVPAPARRSIIPIVLPWAAAAAMFLFAGYLHVQSRSLQQLLNKDRSQIATLSAKASHAQQVMDTLTSPTAQQVTLTASPTTAPTGHASYVSERGALVFVANHLKPVPASKAYELWIIPADSGAPIPAGTFRPDANGSASLVLPKLVGGVRAKAFGVTIEDEGGAQTPTMPILLSGG